MCYLAIVARQRLGKKLYRDNEYTRNNIKIVGHVVFFAARALSK
jgi:hypothetical protein